MALHASSTECWPEQGACRRSQSTSDTFGDSSGLLRAEPSAIPSQTCAVSVYCGQQCQERSSAPEVSGLLEHL